MKTCTKCGIEKPDSEFHKHKQGKLKPRCKTCRRQERQDVKVPCSCGKMMCLGAKSCTICTRANQVGPNSPAWKGGLSKTGHGYIAEWCPTHPAAMPNGRVLQHRLRMEESLGRFLIPGENVHHKNGVRHDNRIENLELWVVHQPSGQRPEDLLEWADEIIRRYRPISGA